MIRALTLLALAQMSAGELGPPQGHASRRGPVTMPADPTQRAVQEQWGYADTVTAGEFVYLSGVADGPARAGEPLDEVYDRLFRRIGRILQDAGCSWDDVIEMTSFHTDLPAQIPAMVRVKARFVRAPFPAWTAVGVVRLVDGDGITEIRVVAKRPKHA